MAGRQSNHNQQTLDRITAVLKHLVQDRDQERERTRGREQETEPAEYRGLTAFKKQQPPMFLGGFDPEGAKI